MTDEEFSEIAEFWSTRSAHGNRSKADNDLKLLIAEIRRLQNAVAEEREACAKIAEEVAGIKSVGGYIASCIRARGGK